MLTRASTWAPCATRELIPANQPTQLSRNSTARFRSEEGSRGPAVKSEIALRDYIPTEDWTPVLVLALGQAILSTRWRYNPTAKFLLAAILPRLVVCRKAESPDLTAMTVFGRPAIFPCPRNQPILLVFLKKKMAKIVWLL